MGEFYHHGEGKLVTHFVVPTAREVVATLFQLHQIPGSHVEALPAESGFEREVAAEIFATARQERAGAEYGYDTTQSDADSVKNRSIALRAQEVGGRVIRLFVQQSPSLGVPELGALMRSASRQIKHRRRRMS